MNALVWLVWAAHASLAVAATRHPLYLTLALLTVMTCYLAVERRRPLGHSPTRLPLRIGVVVCSATVTFNALTAHVGDRVLLRLPANLPVVGGPVTLNAVVYGLLTASVLITVLLVAATLDGGLDRAQALRLVPASLSSSAVAVALGLTLFPSIARAVREVCEAQDIRGIAGSPVSRVRSILVPALHRAMQHAFAVAETLECRAYGAVARPLSQRVLFASLLSSCVLLFALLTGQTGLVVIGLLVTVVPLWIAAPGLVRMVRRQSWTLRDLCALGMTLTGMAILAGTLAFAPSALSYSTYPRLVAPSFEPLVGLGYLCLTAPAAFLRGRIG
jgi:energy-coupling factor transport system permease protein